MQAVILAEGEATRLKPLTDSMPKQLIKLAGKPLIQYNIELFQQHGIRDIIICTSYRREMIRQALGDGSQFNVRLRYSESEQPSGTAGALRKAYPLLTSDRFFVANSDEIKEIDLFAMRRMHEDLYADATVALTRVADVSQFGVAKMAGRKISDFMEKPEPGKAPSNLANAGLYLMERRVLDMIPDHGKPMLEKTVFPQLARQGKLYGFPFGGRWMAIDSLEQFEQAQEMLRN
jgi:NDP-sugar pyrophosphorylase family protein